MAPDATAKAPVTTPAPVPSVPPGTPQTGAPTVPPEIVSPAARPGGAATDAGPPNSSPFSGAPTALVPGVSAAITGRAGRIRLGDTAAVSVRAACCGVGAVRARLAGPSARPLLHLSETATVSVRPDRLTAVLRADASTDSASTAQDRVNAVIGGALAEARKADGIAVSTDQYNVWRLEPKAGEAAQWRASQSVVLRGQDGSSVLKLVGALQQKGLAVEGLGWELAPETARSAETTQPFRRSGPPRAGGRGRRRSRPAIRCLPQFDGRQRSATPIRLRTMAVPAAALASPAEPAAEAEDVRVNATVEADIALKPR